jgi:hypothetical protein
MGFLVSVMEASAAFGTGTSPQNAITIMDEKIDVNGNHMVEIEDLDVEKMMDANSAIAVEKEIAADTLGTLFAATQLHFLPYVESCAMQLIDLLPHYYEGIRKSATDSLLEIVRTFYDISDHPEWQAGLAVRCFASSLSSRLNWYMFSTNRCPPLSRTSTSMLSKHCWRCMKPKTTS